MRAVLSFLVAGVVGAAGPVAAAEDARATVQSRILKLVRDTALKSEYAETEARRLAGFSQQAALRRVTGELRRAGLAVSSGVLPDGQVQVVADWSGRSAPQELVLITARIDGGPENLRGTAAAIAAFKTFSGLRLKPRRTVRLLLATGDATSAALALETYAAAHHARLAHHVVVDSTAPLGVGRGLLAHAPEAALRLLDPLRAVLMPLGLALLEPHRHDPGAATPLEVRGVPMFAPLGETTVDVGAGPPAGATTAQAALLGCLVWLLGEMPDTVPRLPSDLRSAS